MFRLAYAYKKLSKIIIVFVVAILLYFLVTFLMNKYQISIGIHRDLALIIGLSVLLLAFLFSRRKRIDQ